MLVIKMFVRLALWATGFAIRVAAWIVAALAAAAIRIVVGASALAVASARRIGDARAVARTNALAARAASANSRREPSGQRAEAGRS